MQIASAFSGVSFSFVKMLQFDVHVFCFSRFLSWSAFWLYQHCPWLGARPWGRLFLLAFFLLLEVRSYAFCWWSAGSQLLYHWCPSCAEGGIAGCNYSPTGFLWAVNSRPPVDLCSQHPAHRAWPPLGRRTVAWSWDRWWSHRWPANIAPGPWICPVSEPSPPHPDPWHISAAAKEQILPLL